MVDFRVAAAITDKMLVECRAFLKTLDPENTCATKNAECEKSLHHARLLINLFARHKLAAAAPAPANKIDGTLGLPAVLSNKRR